MLLFCRDISEFSYIFICLKQNADSFETAFCLSGKINLHRFCFQEKSYRCLVADYFYQALLWRTPLYFRRRQ